MNAHNLIFSPDTVVSFGGNNFIDVPIILQIGNTPIIETVKEAEVNRTTQFSIFNSDGIYLAKVVGPRLFLTDDGSRSGLTLRHPDKMTVCELDGKTLFEVRREAAAAIAITAELRSPTGVFVKASANIPLGSFSKDGTKIGNATMSGNTFERCPIGFWITDNGGMMIGCAKPPK